MVGFPYTTLFRSDGRVDAYGVRWQTKCDTALTFGTRETQSAVAAASAGALHNIVVGPTRSARSEGGGHPLFIPDSLTNTVLTSFFSGTSVTSSVTCRDKRGRSVATLRVRSVGVLTVGGR